MDFFFYQDIGNNSAGLLNTALIKARQTGYLDLFIHSGGGSVYEGIAMVNSITRERQNGLCTSATIEGIAASMATPLAIATGHVKVRKSARIMIHEITIPNASGNAAQMQANADLIQSFNYTVADIIGKKVNKTREWILENWMKPNVDTWFTAHEALAVGLADEIIDDAPELTADLNTELLAKLQPVELQTTFDAFFSKKALNNKSIFNMNRILELSGVLDDFSVPEGASENQAFTMLKGVIQGMQSEVTRLKAENAQYRLKEVNALMDAKGVPTTLRATYINVANEMGTASAVALLQGIADVNITLQARKEWTYEQWQKEDPEGLLEISKREPERFAEILKTYTGMQSK